MRRCLEIRRELLLKSGVEAYVKAVPIFLHTPWWVNENIDKLEQTEEEIIKTISDIDIQTSRIDGILDFNGKKYLEKKLDIPTLVCCAKDDILTPKHFSDEIAEYIPGCETYRFEKGGHAVSQTLPQEFNRVIISFLKSQEKKN
jgi:aminoacrylate hydrolase